MKLGVDIMGIQIKKWAVYIPYFIINFYEILNNKNKCKIKIKKKKHNFMFKTSNPVLSFYNGAHSLT